MTTANGMNEASREWMRRGKVHSGRSIPARLRAENRTLPVMLTTLLPVGLSLVSVPIFRFILSALRLSFFHLQIMEPSECSE